eukprot:scaffold80624_cov70-Phaeocystis_antarctica.AAC.5
MKPTPPSGNQPTIKRPAPKAGGGKAWRRAVAKGATPQNRPSRRCGLDAQWQSDRRLWGSSGWPPSGPPPTPRRVAPPRAARPALKRRRSRA